MNELAVRHNTQIVTTYDEVERAAKAMAASGFFTDTKSISQAIVKIMAGQELGFGPFASMNGVYIIQGRPSFGANMMAAAVKASGRYNYRVIEMSDTKCEIAFFENGQECGRSSFTLEDAKKAGTKNLDKFPRNMLFARAMSNGVRWYCPDVTNGSTVYTPEELGAEVDAEGNVVELPTEVIEAEVIEEQVTDNLEQLGSEPEPVEKIYDFKTRPYDPETLRAALLKKADDMKPASDKQIQLAGMIFSQYFQDDELEKEAKIYLLGVDSLKKARPELVNALLKWMDLKQDDGGAYHINETPRIELSRVLDAYAKERGQKSLF